MVYQKYYPTYALSHILDEYGFVDVEQKQSLQDLFKQASIIPPDKSWEDIFPKRAAQDELLLDLVKIIEETQEKFTIRSGTQERWEVQPLEWMQRNEERLLHNLKVLGFVEAVSPKVKKVDAICILGARKKIMAERIKYVEFLQKTDSLQAKAIILLAGERYVTEGVDGTEEELSHIAKIFKLDDWRKLTETHLIQYLYNRSELYKSSLPVYVIDTPARELPRPTTQTTILELISWLQNHDGIQSILFISNQPYVKYQGIIISLTFKEKRNDIVYEIVGPSVAQPSNIPSIIEGLGSYIWAASPTVLARLNVDLINPGIKAALKKLYLKHPLIYHSLPKSVRH